MKKRKNKQIDKRTLQEILLCRCGEMAFPQFTQDENGKKLELSNDLLYLQENNTTSISLSKMFQMTNGQLSTLDEIWIRAKKKNDENETLLHFKKGDEVIGSVLVCDDFENKTHNKKSYLSLAAADTFNIDELVYFHSLAMLSSETTNTYIYEGAGNVDDKIPAGSGLFTSVENGKLTTGLVICELEIDNIKNFCKRQ